MLKQSVGRMPGHVRQTGMEKSFGQAPGNGETFPRQNDAGHARLQAGRKNFPAAAPRHQPQPTEPMKRFPLFVLAGVISLAAIPPFASSLLANMQPPGNPPEWRDPGTNHPLGRDCVVTVDPQDKRTPVYAGIQNIVTGFDAPDTVRGTLIRVDDDWLVLRDGKSENWIPRNKVLLIHVCI